MRRYLIPPVQSGFDKLRSTLRLTIHPREQIGRQFEADRLFFIGLGRSGHNLNLNTLIF